MKRNKRPLRRTTTATHFARNKARVNWLLDKFNDVIIAAYGLLAYDKWIAAFHLTATNSEVVALLVTSAGLIAFWMGIGIYKGELEEEL